MLCTWVDCEKEATTLIKEKDGKDYANLCDEHNKELNDSINKNPFNAAKMLQCWIKAGGGAKKMSERM
jgi:hypothetical protein